MQENNVNQLKAFLVNIHQTLFNGLGVIYHQRMLSVFSLSLGLVVLSSFPSYAQTVSIVGGIEADRSAPSGQRPTVITTATGIPQVDITTPSRSGVSMNQFKRLDVDSKGAILNNSRKATNTQIAGTVRANANMARGEASVIVNQVNSNKPSYLNGYIEVAGKKADVIIANPTGLSVNGGGFLNAGKVTLNAGSTQVNGSNISHNISDGTISVSGKGLDVRSTNYTALLARGVKINAKIHQGQGQLDVITGENTISNDGKILSTQSSSSAKSNSLNPSKFAIDTGDLGGMYAGKIRLIGTENGLGVNHGGMIQSDELTLSTDGKLVNKGTINSTRTTIDVKNNDVENTGTFSTALLNLSAKSLVNTGTIEQSNINGLSINANQISNTKDGLIGAPKLTGGSGSNGSSSKGGSVSSGKSTTGSSGGKTGSGKNTGKGIAMNTSGLISLTGNLTNNGKLLTNGKLALTAKSKVFNQGKISNKDLVIQSNEFNNQGDLSNGLTKIEAAKLFSNSGKIKSASNLDIKSTNLQNAGDIYISNQLDINTSDLMNAGQINSKKLNLTSVSSVDNQAKGNIRSEQLSLSTKKLNNEGTIAQIGQSNLIIQTKQLNNKNKAILGNNKNSNKSSNSSSTASKSNKTQTVKNNNQNQKNAVSKQSNKNVNSSKVTNLPKLFTGVIKVDDELINSGSITANGSVDVNLSNALDNAGLVNINHIELKKGKFLNNGEFWTNTADLSLNDLTNNGAFTLNANTAIKANQFNNSGNFTAKGLNVSTNQLTNSGNLSSLSTLNIQSKDSVSNQGGKIQSNQALSINTEGEFDNTSGQLISAKKVSLNASQLTNQKGLVFGESLLINAKNGIDNQNTNSKDQGILSQGSQTLITNSLNNNKGQVKNGDELLISHQLTDDKNQKTVINNQEGTITSKKAIKISAKTLNNSQGLLSTGSAEISSKDYFNNRSGKLLVNNLNLNTANLTNDEGLIESNVLTDINAKALSNTKGVIQSKSQLSVATSSQSLSGQLLANNALRLTVDGNFTNNAELKSSGITTIKSKQLTNNKEISGSQINLDISSDVTNQKDGKIIAENQTQIKAQGGLENRGLIDGKTTLISAAKVDNYHKIYGDKLAISGEKSITNHNNAVIASRESALNLGTKHLINNEDAMITSQGQLNVGSSLDNDFATTGKADQIDNLGATLSSQGRMELAVKQINNKNIGFSFSDKETKENIWQRYVQFFKESKKLYKSSELGNCYRCMDKNNGNFFGRGRDPFSGSTWDSHRGYVMGLDNTWGLEWVLPSEKYPFEKGFLKGTYGYKVIDSDRTKQDVRSIGNGDNDKPEFFTRYFYKNREYPDDSPLWKLFDVEVGEYDELIGKLTIYNIDYMSRARRTFNHIDITQRVTKETTVDNKGKAATISSGGDLVLKGAQADNEHSRILVGKSIKLEDDAKSINNIKAKGVKTITEYGRKKGYLVKYKGYKRDNRYGNTAYTYVKSTETTNLSLGEIKESAQAQAKKVADNNRSSVDDKSNTETTNVKITVNNNVVRSIAPNTMNISSNKLFNVENINAVAVNNSAVTDRARESIVVTDPQFTGDRRFTSSAFLFELISQSPDQFTKRLGDGYYEQTLVRDQVANLTGRRYLDGFSSDDEQYKALLNEGAKYAKKYNIRPGVALSKSQMDSLTSDLVWMVKETVTLPDGSTTEALVPKVYTVANKASVTGEGSVISAKNIEGQLSGDLNNQGKLLVENNIRVKANNINNSGDLLADKVLIQADEDINNIGGRITAQSQVVLDAGRDTNIKTTIRSASAKVGSSAKSTLTQIDRVGLVEVKGNSSNANQDDTSRSNLVINANRNVNLTAAGINNKSDERTVINTKNGSINLDTVKTESYVHTYQDVKNNYTSQSSQEVGASILGKRDVVLNSADNINVKAGSINSGQGQTALIAKNNINITEGRVTDDFDVKTYYKKSGRFKKRSSTYRGKQTKDESISSNITGNKVLVVSDAGDVNIKGSNVVSDHGTHIQAKKDVNITSAENHYKSDIYEKRTKSGLMSSGGLGISIGKQMQSTDKDSGSTVHQGSMVGSVKKGNTTIIAGENYAQKGSSVNALDGDVNVVAKQISVLNAENKNSEKVETKFKQSGLTVALSGAAVSAVNTAQDTVNNVKQMGDTGNSRVKGMLAGAAALNAYAASESLQSVAQNPSAAVGVTVSLGSQSKKSKRISQSSTAAASKINASGAVNLVATGGDKSSINIQGSDVAGKAQTNLKADQDIRITSAQEHSQLRSTNKSKGGSIGMSFGAGGIGVSASVNKGRGYANGDSVNHRDSRVGSTTGKTNIQSGNKLGVRGAQVLGDSIKVRAKALEIASLQNTDTYKSKQKSMGANMGISSTGVVTGGLSGGKSKINSNYAAVGTQSGLFAGDGGYDVAITNHTSLNGGVITSSNKAEQSGKNKFSTGTLSATDIKNISEYKGEAISVEISGSFDTKNHGTDNSKTGANLPSTGVGEDSGKDQSVTRSGINTDNIMITDTQSQSKIDADIKAKVKTDRDSESVLSDTGLANIFDADKVNSSINQQVSAMQGLNKASNKVAGIISQKQEVLEKAYKDKKISEAEYEERKRQYENSKLILNSITGALGTPSSGAGGIIAQGVSPFVAKQIGDYFAENNKTGSLSHGLAHAFLAGAVAAAGGNNIGTAALVAGGAEVIAPVLSNFLYGTTDSSKLTEAQKRTISSISSLAGMAAGASTGNITDIVSTGQAAKNAVENNYLTKKDVSNYFKELKSCKSGGGSNDSCRLKLDEKYKALSERRNQDLKEELKNCNQDPACIASLNKKVTELSAEDIKIIWGGFVNPNEENLLESLQKEGKLTVLSEVDSLRENFRQTSCSGYGSRLCEQKFSEEVLQKHGITREHLELFDWAKRFKAKGIDGLDVLVDSGQLSPATAATLYAFIAILPDSEIDAFFAGVGGAGKAISSVGKLSKNTAKAGALKNTGDLAIGSSSNTSKNRVKSRKGVIRGKHNRVDVRYKSSKEVNDTFPDNWSPPYKPNTRVTEFTTIKDDIYVRVHGENNQARSWMMKKEAIEGMTAKEIKSKYSLPELPTYVSEVHVPAGTRIRTGVVNPLPEFNGVGNATQYELLQRLPHNSFRNRVKLK